MVNSASMAHVLSAAADAIPGRRVATLVEAVQELSLARDLDGITEVVRVRARELTGADGATFILCDGDECHYVDEEAIGPLWKGQRFPRSECVSGWAMENGEPAVIEDIEVDDRVPLHAYRPTFVKSLVVVPIRARDPIGAIGNYWAHKHRATPEELAVLQALADSTSIALENVDLYAGLEHRVEERTQALERANHELEAFGYSVAHDLRGPLTLLRGWSDMMANDHLPPDRMRAGAVAINNAASRMGTIIDALLQLSSVTGAELVLETVNLSDMAEAVVRDLRAASPDRAVAVEVQPEIRVRGDRGLLRIAMENLLGNAWKYTARTPDPRISVSADERDDALEIAVRDNGAGFDPAAASQIFEAFHRVHSPAEFPGTGIGLATVDRIVRRHDGAARAEGELGGGATIFVSLPPA